MMTQETHRKQLLPPTKLQATLEHCRGSLRSQKATCKLFFVCGFCCCCCCCVCRDRVLLYCPGCLKLLTSSDLPTSASQSAVITDISHCAWPSPCFLQEAGFYQAAPPVACGRVERWRLPVSLHQREMRQVPCGEC